MDVKTPRELISERLRNISFANFGDLKVGSVFRYAHNKKLASFVKVDPWPPYGPITNCRVLDSENNQTYSYFIQDQALVEVINGQNQ